MTTFTGRARIHEFAAALHEGVARLRLSRSEIASAVGVTPRTVSRWNVGDLVPHEDNHDALLALFADAGDDVVVRMRRALGHPDPEPPAPPRSPAAPPPRDDDAAKQRVNLAVYEAAEAVDRSARVVRDAFADLLGKLAAIGLTLEEAQRIVRETAPSRPHVDEPA